MGSVTFVLLVAFIGGVAVVLQAQFTGILDSRLGTLESVFITYGLGGGAIALLMLLNRGGHLSDWRSVPWFALTAGLLGLIIIGALSYAVPRLGIVATFTVFIATQLILGMVFDHFGLFGGEVRAITLSRALGTAVILFGTWLVLK